MTYQSSLLDDSILILLVSNNVNTDNPQSIGVLLSWSQKLDDNTL